MFSQIYLNKLINKDKYDRGELLCLSLINLDDISHAQTQLIRSCEFSSEYAEIQEPRNRGGRGAGAMAAPFFQWIIKKSRIKSSLHAWNNSRAILSPPPPHTHTSKQAPRSM
jgi:hypothetical protein